MPCGVFLQAFEFFIVDSVLHLCAHSLCVHSHTTPFHTKRGLCHCAVTASCLLPSACWPFSLLSLLEARAALQIIVHGSPMRADHLLLSHHTLPPSLLPVLERCINTSRQRYTTDEWRRMSRCVREDTKIKQCARTNKRTSFMRTSCAAYAFA